MEVIDIRVELPDEGDGSGGYDPSKVSGYVAALRSARKLGDLANESAWSAPAQAGESLWRCRTWTPNSSCDALSGLAEVSDRRVISMVRCVPADWGGGTVLAPWVLGDLPALLADLGIPFFIELTPYDTPPYEHVYTLASRYSQLPVVLGLGGNESIEILLALARACPNLLIETSGIPKRDAMRQIRSRLGSRRLVFGSGFPWGDVEASVAFVVAALGEDGQADVLYRNSSALIEGQWTRH